MEDFGNKFWQFRNNVIYNFRSRLDDLKYALDDPKSEFLSYSFDDLQQENKVLRMELFEVYKKVTEMECDKPLTNNKECLGFDVSRNSSLEEEILSHRLYNTELKRRLMIVEAKLQSTEDELLISRAAILEAESYRVHNIELKRLCEMHVEKMGFLCEELLSLRFENFFLRNTKKELIEKRNCLEHEISEFIKIIRELKTEIQQKDGQLQVLVESLAETRNNLLQEERKLTTAENVARQNEHRCISQAREIYKLNRTISMFQRCIISSSQGTLVGYKEQDSFLSTQIIRRQDQLTKKQLKQNDNTKLLQDDCTCSDVTYFFSR